MPGASQAKAASAPIRPEARIRPAQVKDVFIFGKASAWLAEAWLAKVFIPGGIHFKEAVS